MAGYLDWIKDKVGGFKKLIADNSKVSKITPTPVNSKISEAMNVAKGMVQKPARWDTVYPGIPYPNQTATQPLVLGQSTQGVGETLGQDFAFSTQGKPELPRNLIDTVNTAATNAGLDPRVLASVPAQESGGFGYKPVVGTSGERGITQIIPKWYYKEAGYKTPEEYGLALESNNEFAVKETARILKKNYTARKSIFDALREYNAGPRLVGGTEYAIQVLKRVGLEDEIPEEYKKTKVKI